MSTVQFPNYKIFTDATADMNDSMLADLPSVETIPMNVVIDGENYLYGPGGNLTVSHFYSLLHSGKFASTSQINPQTYRTAFEKALKSGYDVLYLCFSSGLSGTIGNAALAIEELKSEYPERTILCLDTLAASVGEGFLVREAARLQSSGMDIHELYVWLERHRLEVCHWFSVDTFDHLRHGGRVSSISAIAGGVLNIKPLLHVDEHGNLQLMKKPRGQKQAIREQINCMQHGWNPEIGNLVVIGHGDSPLAAMSLRDQIRDRFPEADLHVADVGPIIGAHTGPGVLVLTYWGGNR